MDITDTSTISDRLRLVESSQKMAWIKWLGNGLIEILDTSMSVLKVKTGQTYHFKDFVDKKNFELVTHYYDSLTEEIATLSFTVQYGGDLLTCFAYSYRKPDEIISLWVLKPFEVDYQTLFQMIGHDMRSPINATISMINLIKQQVGDDEISSEELLNMLGMIEKSSYQAIDLTNDVLELAKIESSEFRLFKKPVLLEDFVLNYINTHRLLTIKKQIQVHYHPQSRAVVEIDESKITRVLDNLISNAVKFSEVGSKIDIQLKEDQETVAIIIKDEGIGMSPEIIANIFRKFGNSRRNGLDGEKSHGLGMPIVKQIMELHGGEVAIKSEVGKGTEVRLIFRILSS